MAVPQELPHRSHLRVQDVGTDPGKIRSSGCQKLKHMLETSLRLIILRSFELNMLGSSFAEKALISEFLISCAAELKA